MMKEQPVKGTLPPKYLATIHHGLLRPADTLCSLPTSSTGAKAYYFRGVLHDHSDVVCRKFLTHIKDAMGPYSRLLIHEKLVADVNPTTMATKSDLLMMSVYAAMERSAGQMKQLLESVGFKVLGKHSGAGSSEWHIMEAILG